MKRFLGKKDEPGRAKPSKEDPTNESLHSESDSLSELRPMFTNQGFASTNDQSLNLNPSITAPESVVTEASQAPGKSVFSSRYSASTKQSSQFSSSSRKKYNSGQPLQILEAADEHGDEERATTLESIGDRLHALYRDVAYVSGQFQSSAINLSSAVVAIINCLQEFGQFMDPPPSLRFNFHAYNNDDVRRLLRVYLHFYDNLLRDDAYVKLKLLLCKTFNDFASSLKSSPQMPSSHMVKPQNYAVGVNDGMPFKNQDAISRIVHKIANTSRSLREQNGSFIAPIARGISKDMNVLTLYFGYPQISEQHSRIPQSIHELYDDVHVMVAQNKIELASQKVQTPLVPQPQTQSHETETAPESRPDIGLPSHTFKLPFRNPADSSRPPMSLSLSTESSSRASGTMGGFIYPIIDPSRPELASYANSKFAISCGHVCLENEGKGDYPYISSPSAVLISLYKKALKHEHDKSGVLDARVAYSSALGQLDRMFPVSKVKVDGKSGERVEYRNLPKHRFGQIIWGERTLIQAKKSSTGAVIRDKRLSDLAIIKVNKLLQCEQNFLGDDVAFNEYDPSLMFDNLYVRRIIDIKRNSKEFDLAAVKEVDSVLSTSSRNSDGTFNNSYGLPVFKYGSTTKFTRGHLNGVKLVYWMDGAIHSSEFVVNSVDSTSSFAAGGDSGAWILAKLEDVRGSNTDKGLGVVGMLHSYDGEYRQFGLFTPMNEILDRLQDVTNISWGVVGVPRKDEVEVSSESEPEISDASDSEYESGVEDQAYPPDID